MFTEKKKEPALSEQMKEGLLRSLGDKSTSFYNDVIRLKHEIKNVLLSNEDLLRTLHYAPLIGTKDEVNGDKYADVCIFDYMKLDDFREDVKNFLCFEVEEKHGYQNSCEMIVTIRCVAHKDDVKTDWGVPRMDLMAAIINKDFSWTNHFGKSWIKSREVAILANNEYFARDIMYIITLPNDEYYRIHGNDIGGFRSKNLR